MGVDFNPMHWPGDIAKGYGLDTQTDWTPNKIDFGGVDPNNPNVDPRLKRSTDPHGMYDWIGPSERSAEFNSDMAQQQANQFLKDQYAQQTGAYGGLNGLGAVAQDYRNYLTGASGPSRAQLLAQQMESQTAANAMGLAASQRGGASAGGTRAAIMAGNQAALQSGAQIGQLRAQEQEAARQGMLGAYNQQAQGYGALRAQSLGGYGAGQQAAQGWYGQALGAEQGRVDNQFKKDSIQAANTNANNALEQQVHEDNSAGILSLNSKRSDWHDKSQVVPVTAAANVDAPAQKQQSWYDNLSDTTSKLGQARGQDGVGKIAGLVGAAEGLIALSDKRDKEYVSRESGKRDELAALLESIRPVAFDYKPGSVGPDAPPGRHVGLFAQDLERTPAGASMVTTTPTGKKVDTGQAALAALAAAADLNKRLKAVEGRRG